MEDKGHLPSVYSDPAYSGTAHVLYHGIGQHFPTAELNWCWYPNTAKYNHFSLLLIPPETLKCVQVQPKAIKYSELFYVDDDFEGKANGLLNIITFLLNYGRCAIHHSVYQ